MRDYLHRRTPPLLSAIAALLVLAACGRGGEPATRTPVPTWTPTPLGATAALAQPAAPQAVDATATPLPPPATDTPLPVTSTFTPVPTAPPTETPVPTALPPTETPTQTATPQPTATPSYDFELEAAERFPTESLAADVVRIWLYAYSPAELGLADYSLRVAHNGVPLAVEEVTAGGVPEQTRSAPGPFTRFTNMSLIFVEPQGGQWEVQLVDAEGNPAGPPALFDLTPTELTREIYVRYKQVSQ